MNMVTTGIPFGVGIIIFVLGIIVGAVGSRFIFRNNPKLQDQVDAAAKELEKKMKGEK
jgi:uncharacterized membrane-anchored protein YhcB (DUF1043 family)